MMASACVNNLGVQPESFSPPYAWINPNVPHYPANDSAVDPTELPRRSADRVDFEFRLDEVRVTMLAADELFSEGKLVPLHVTALRTPADPLLSPEADSKPWICAEGIGSESFVLSPKAPRCSARWRDLLGLKRLQNPKKEPSKTASVPSEQPTGSKTPTGKSFKNLLQRHLKSSIDPLLGLPLLRDGNPDAVSSSLSSRLSLSSSSSSGPEHEDLPRLSLDSEKPRNPPRVRISRPLSSPPEGNFPSRVSRFPGRQPLDNQSVQAWGCSVDSPRMNPSGRIIFEGLERSSSSPSSFNGVPTTKYRGMQRSYSANVRIPSVLNVPVCSIRRSSKSVSVFGFGPLFSQPRKDRDASSSSSSSMGRPANIAAASAAGGKTTMDSARKRERIRARREPRGF